MQREEEYRALVNQSYIEMQKGDIRNAWLCLQKAYDAGFKAVELHIAFGGIYEQMQAIDKAYAAYNYAIEIDKNSAQAYNNRGRIALMIGRLDKAMVDFRKTIELQPENGRAYYNIGCVLEQREQFAQAVQAFQKAVKLKYPLAEKALVELQKRLSKPASPQKDTQRQSEKQGKTGLEWAMIELAAFAYAMMGPHQKVEMVQTKGLFGLGSKQQLVGEFLWNTTLEEMAQVTTNGWNNQLGAVLEINQKPQFLVRVIRLNTNEYETSIWFEHQAAGTKKQTLARSNKSYVAAESELRGVLHGLVEKKVLVLRNGTLVYPVGKGIA